MTIHEGDGQWVRRFHPAAEQPHRLVCLPHAGGAASFFFPLSQALAPYADVMSIQYPGRQDRRHERLRTTIGQLAEETYQALLPWADRPLVLFGHSMGAVISFEVARRFERDGAPVRGLIVSGRRAPDIHLPARAHLLSDDELVEEIRKLSGTDPGILQDDEILRMIVPAIRADYEAVESYRYEPDGPGPALGCPLSVFTGDADPRVSVAQAMAWADFSSGPFNFRTFPGGHFYLTPRRDAVTRAIAEDLAGFTRSLIGW
jgi:surfactin synthase thioesterase subunit